MSKRKEIVLKRTLDSDWRRGRVQIACHEQTRKFFVGLPEDATKAYAVFTNDKPTDNNYTIKKPIPSFWQSDKSRLIGIGNVMYDGAEYLLAEMYNKGYRYLQVEYDA